MSMELGLRSLYNNGFILSLQGLFVLGLIMPNPIVGSECHPHNGKSRCWIKMPPTDNWTPPFFSSAKCSTHAPTNLLFDLRYPIARIENNLSVFLFPQVLKENCLKLSDNEWWILVTLNIIKVSRRGLQYLVSCSFLSIENRCVRIYDKIRCFLIYFFIISTSFPQYSFLMSLFWEKFITLSSMRLLPWSWKFCSFSHWIMSGLLWISCMQIL